MHRYTMEEMVKVVARAAAREHSPKDPYTKYQDVWGLDRARWRCEDAQFLRSERNVPRTTRSVKQIMSDAVVKGRSHVLDPRAHLYDDGFLIEVRYSENAVAGYEVAPTESPVIWYN